MMRSASAKLPFSIFRAYHSDEIFSSCVYSRFYCLFSLFSMDVTMDPACPVEKLSLKLIWFDILVGLFSFCMY